MEGVQLWVAQPDATRHSRPAFAHHPHLPVIDLGRGQATVLLGEFAGVESPGQVDMPLVGLDVTGSESLELPLEPRFEYGVIVLRGHLRFQDVTVSPDELLSLGRGQDGITLDLAPDSRAILLGGEPLEEEIFMWWNFVGRDRTEMERARADWQAASERFGAVDSTLTRIDAPHPFWRPEGAM
jgi:redox-sensitive bicupin YhaK (pirin superfamily)